ncbi:hypothetical protein J2Z79_002745 [Symbiobacterium terraclitae]|uniref:Uncharacterized protein n=1 Tax=Symbiobacterium terraclitae TaxID=557451 RepID=A0ABS4JUU4_9FIRM|nr:hypothetical protein [Symbiobacterium terraclitae]MBP2019318.1 hypothetical protein [Symbiobacterium terraclitae]
MRTKSERLIERARKEFRYGRSDELQIVRQVIRAGTEESERGELFEQVNRLLGKGRRTPDRQPSTVC